MKLTDKDTKEFIKVIESNPEFFKKHVDAESMEELKRSAHECYNTYRQFTDLILKQAVELFDGVQAILKLSYDERKNLED